MEFLRRRLGLIIKLLVSAGILGYLAYKVDLKKVGATMAAMDPLWTAGAFLCFAPILLITAWRWRLLLRVQEVDIPYRQALELCLVGQFFNAFLLGANGGDVVKIYYTTRAAPDRKTAAGFSVIVDRMIVGLVPLVLIAVVLCLVHYDFLTRDPSAKIAVWTVFAIAAACFGGLAVLPFLPKIRDFADRRGWWARLPLHGFLDNLLEATARYLTNWRATLIGFLVTFPSHGLNFVLGYCLIKAMHLDVPMAEFFSTVPIILLLTAVPVTFSGFGVREGLAVLFLGLVGVDSAHAVTYGFMLYLVPLGWSLFGAFFYLRYRSPERVESSQAR